MMSHRGTKTIGIWSVTWGLTFVLGLGRAGLADEVDSPVTVISGDTPAVEFVQDDSEENDEYIWTVFGNDEGFGIEDTMNGFKLPFFLEAGAPDNSLYVGADGSTGMGTDVPRKILNTTTTGRFLNVRTDVTGAEGYARIVAQGKTASQLHLVHLGAAANQKVFRMQCSNGVVGFHVVKDDLSAHTINNAMLIKMSNGYLGLQMSPAHPLHLKSGAHCTAGGVWTSVSSREMKQDIEPVTSQQAQEAVRALQPVGFRYKNELEERYVGFIAEDVPELVATNDRKGLVPMDVVAVLTKVVQDQNTQLEQQQKLLDEQGAMLRALTNRLDQMEGKTTTTKTP